MNARVSSILYDIPVREETFYIAQHQSRITE